jgi:hypothetical protein
VNTEGKRLVPAAGDGGRRTGQPGVKDLEQPGQLEQAELKDLGQRRLVDPEPQVLGGLELVWTLQLALVVLVLLLVVAVAVVVRPVVAVVERLEVW